MEYLLLILVAAAGSLMQRVTGFGFSIFAMLFLPLFVGSFAQASALAGLLSLVSGLIVCSSSFKHVNWKKLIIPVPACVVTSYFAVRFMTWQKDTTLRVMLGVFLILLSVYFIFFSSKIRIKPSWYGGLAAGGISGVLTGLFSMGGPPIVIYFMQSEKDVKRYLATMQAYFMLSNFFNTAIRASAGFVTGKVLLLWGVGAVGIAAGIWIGKKIVSKLNVLVVKRLVYGMMAASGVVYIVTSLA